MNQFCPYEAYATIINQLQQQSYFHRITQPRTALQICGDKVSQASLLRNIGRQGSRMRSRKNGMFKEKPPVAILLPTYCEAGNIESLIRDIKRVQPNSLIAIIDDSSHDGTATIAMRLQKEYKNILVFTRFKRILSLTDSPDYIVTMDADFSHNPQAIPELLEAAENGYDLVIGSRYTKGSKIVGWHIIRWLISRVANFIASTMVRMRISDCTSGFRCYSKKYVENVIGYLHSQTYEIQIETVKQAWTRGFKVKEIPITFENRKKGKSKLTRAEFQGFLSYIMKTKLPINKAH